MMGYVYNVSDDTETSGPQMVAIIAILTLTSLGSVCLRAYVRYCVTGTWGSDDWSVFISWIGAFVFGIGSCIQTRWGLGLVQIGELPQENVPTFDLIQFVGGPFYVLSILCFKFSVLMSYLRFMPTGWWRNGTIFITTTITAIHVAFLLLFMTICSPGQEMINESPNCHHQAQSCLIFPIMAIITHIIILILPFPILLRLKIEPRRKAALLVLFALGLFLTIVSIVRYVTIRSVPSYLDTAQPITWSAVECNFGVILACLPTYMPLIKFFRQSNMSTRDIEAEAGNYGALGGSFASAPTYVVSEGSWPLHWGKAKHLNEVSDLSSEGRSSTRSVPSLSGKLEHVECTDPVHDMKKGSGTHAEIEITVGHVIEATPQASPIPSPVPSPSLYSTYDDDASLNDGGTIVPTSDYLDEFLKRYPCRAPSPLGMHVYTTDDPPTLSKLLV